MEKVYYKLLVCKWCVGGLGVWGREGESEYCYFGIGLGILEGWFEGGMGVGGIVGLS